MRAIVLCFELTACLALASCTLPRGGLLGAGEGTGANGAGGFAGAAPTTSSTGGGTTGAAGAGGGTGVGGATGGGGGSGGMAGQGGCPVAPGPAMVAIEHPLGDYCIDSTEVTSAHYQAFLAASPSVGLPPECSWKQGFVPRPSGYECQPKHYDPVGLPGRPVACVDWCDAYAYCTWAGKRLCGKIGGGAVPFDAFADADQSEWFNACSKGGERDYPYGDGYQPAACAGDDYDGVKGDGATDDAVDAGTLASCEGGYTGLFDLSGNVWEWERSCSSGGGPNTPCRDRGGSFWDGAGTYLECDGVGPSNHTRGYYNKNIGFRCCADPLP